MRNLEVVAAPLLADFLHHMLQQPKCYLNLRLSWFFDFFLATLMVAPLRQSPILPSWVNFFVRLLKVGRTTNAVNMILVGCLMDSTKSRIGLFDIGVNKKRISLLVKSLTLN